MSTIDSENAGKPALEAVQPKAGRKPAKTAKPAKKGGPGQESGQQVEGGPHQQEGRGHRHDAAREGRHVGRDSEGH
jgi:hypothetical protein